VDGTKESDMSLNYDPDQPAGGSPALTGHAVLDSHLRTVGKVTDVLFDDTEMKARWEVVKMGVLRREHYVPLADSYLDEEGSLVVPYDKSSIEHAPHARGAHVLTAEVARELLDYYGIAA
jgi:sporulation protein YlmC with PRC-barrel domain